MNFIKSIFKDDLSVTKAPYLQSLLKAVLIGFVVYMAFQISNLVTSSPWYGILSLTILGIGIWHSQKIGLTFFNIHRYTWKDLLYVIGGYIVLKTFDVLFVLVQVDEEILGDQLVANAFSGTPKWLLVISLAIVPAIVEELLFRGLLLRVVFRNHLFIGLIVSSVLFAAQHASNNFIDYFPYFISGIIFGLVYLKTGKIENAMAIHFLNNVVFALFLNS